MLRHITLDATEPVRNVSERAKVRLCKSADRVSSSAPLSSENASPRSSAICGLLVALPSISRASFSAAAALCLYDGWDRSMEVVYMFSS